MRTTTIHQFLTKPQIALAAKLYAEHGDYAADLIRLHVIEPNMPTINAKLGQENDARYLAYAVVYALSQTEVLS